MTTGPSSVLGCSGLGVDFTVRSGGRARTVRAVNDVSFEVTSGQIVGIVGESGSGKTTVARTLVGLQQPTFGHAWCMGTDLGSLRARDRKQLGRQIAMIFQDPRSSLNPRLSVGAVIVDPLVVHKIGDRAARTARVDRLLADVGLDPATARRPVRSLSGGQLQRVAIARALALEPAVIVADEPTSALDVSVQAQILNLIRDLQPRYEFGMLIISHDMRVMRALSDDLLVMLDGQVVERGRTAEVFTAPRHDYTAQLLAATPLLIESNRVGVTTEAESADLRSKGTR